MDSDIRLNDHQKQFITKLYECSSCNKCIYSKPTELGNELGMSLEEVDETIRFFMEKRMIRQMTSDGEVAITQVGIKYVSPCACK